MGKLSKIIVAAGLEKLPKVQLIAKSGHTNNGRRFKFLFVLKDGKASWSRQGHRHVIGRKRKGHLRRKVLERAANGGRRRPRRRREDASLQENTNF